MTVDQLAVSRQPEKLTNDWFEFATTLVLNAADFVSLDVPRAVILRSNSPEGLVAKVADLLTQVARHPNVYNKSEWVTYFTDWAAKLAELPVHTRDLLIESVLWGNVEQRRMTLAHNSSGAVVADRFNGEFALIANADMKAPEVTVLDVDKYFATDQL